MKILLVGLSGGIGSICRYLIMLLCPSTGTWMGLGTWIVNTIGCLIIGVLAGYALVSPWSTPYKSIFVLMTMTGFCGGFSTFSSFTLDCVRYFEAGQLWIWIILGTMTVFCGLFACALGYWLGQRL